MSRGLAIPHSVSPHTEHQQVGSNTVDGKSSKAAKYRGMISKKTFPLCWRCITQPKCRISSLCYFIFKTTDNKQDLADCAAEGPKSQKVPELPQVTSRCSCAGAKTQPLGSPFPEPHATAVPSPWPCHHFSQARAAAPGSAPVPGQAQRDLLPCPAPG